MADISGVVTGTLAPMVLISATGLFVLALQNRYGRVVDRIRLLDAKLLELGRIEHLEGYAIEQERNIRAQLDVMLRRGAYIKNSMFFSYVGILAALVVSMLFMITAIQGVELGVVIVPVFAASICAFFIGVFYATLDSYHAYEAVLIEVRLGRAKNNHNDSTSQGDAMHEDKLVRSS